jgi:hypothetical protein
MAATEAETIQSKGDDDMHEKKRADAKHRVHRGRDLCLRWREHAGGARREDAVRGQRTDPRLRIIRGQFTGQQVNALAGLVSYRRESGRWKGLRRFGAGRRAVSSTWPRSVPAGDTQSSQRHSIFALATITVALNSAGKNHRLYIYLK